MSTYKRLAGDTAIYGLSSIMGKVIIWLLMPYYTHIFKTEQYGDVVNLYQYLAFLLIILTYGMETSFFRYASKSENPGKVYSTALIALFSTSFVFFILFLLLRNQIATLIQFPNHPEYILWAAVILFIDAFTAIPFANLRIKHRPLRFAFIKLINIALTILLNIFFFTVCPWLLEKNPDSFIFIIYKPEIGIGYVFIANIIASIIMLAQLLTDILKTKLVFDYALFRQLFKYAFPILILGIAGTISQGIDKIMIPFLIPDELNPRGQLGIYAAGFKLAVLMNMFIQAFRYAFEPFFFSRSKSKDDPRVYAIIMKYFVIFGLLIFLGMMFYIDLILLIIGSDFREGLRVVPFILMANLFFGIYFSLSLWYKLTDKTIYGAYQGLIGAAITIILNLILIPTMGYMGAAFTQFISFFVIMVISYIVGQKYYPVPYNLKRIGSYFLIAGILYFLSFTVSDITPWIKYLFNTLLLISFLTIVFMLENREIGILFKFNKKN